MFIPLTSSCELLSDCIFDLLNTTKFGGEAYHLRLWIAFRLYLWLIEHNLLLAIYGYFAVVNCFQIVSLTYWTQPSANFPDTINSCELLSDCIFDLLNTTSSQAGNWMLPLWIAFRLYLWLIEHNRSLKGRMWLTVVNCFQIVSLTYWTQPFFVFSMFFIGCELLSDCIFDLLNTTSAYGCWLAPPLWIAFRLYLWLIEHNKHEHGSETVEVVNCFQIVSLTYWTQLNGDWEESGRGCELLSDCIFDLLNTTRIWKQRSYHALWIAFRLYLWLIEHNAWWPWWTSANVVNCFQIVSLTYWTQQLWLGRIMIFSCELLSDCIFDLLNTTLNNYKQWAVELWIAFRLYLWLIEHNPACCRCSLTPVVNCFQIVSLTYWTQHNVTRFELVIGCELLSDCIFDLLNTTTHYNITIRRPLWIAFRLYLWLIEHNRFRL